MSDGSCSTREKTESLTAAIKSFRWAARRAFHLGLQAGTGGNLSLRLGPDLFLAKPTGIGLTECRRSNLVLVNGEGRIVAGKIKPTKEVMTHLAIYQVRPEVGGIVHYHAAYATAYAVKNRCFPLLTLHARRLLKHLPLIPEYPEGSGELSQAVREATLDASVSGLLLAGHGMMALGPTLQQAQSRPN